MFLMCMPVTVETRKGHQIPWNPLMWVLTAGLGSWGRVASPSQQSTPALLYCSDCSDSTIMLNFSLLQMKLGSLEVHRSHLSLLYALTAEDHNTSFIPWRSCVEGLKRTGARSLEPQYYWYIMLTGSWPGSILRG